jgi:hypothetical protein
MGLFSFSRSEDAFFGQLIRLILGNRAWIC